MIESSDGEVASFLAQPQIIAVVLAVGSLGLFATAGCSDSYQETSPSSIYRVRDASGFNISHRCPVKPHRYFPKLRA